MATLTITEALAELKTIDKRLEKKREFVLGYLYRQNLYKDPLDKDGGSREAVKAERQAIADLEERKVAIRRAVALANEATPVTVNGCTRTVSGWLTFRRDVVPARQKFLAQLKQKLDAVRRDAQSKGLALAADVTAATNSNDIIVNVSERDLAAEAEALEVTLGALDGQLSLKNATVTIEV